jgi:hypothetical protein
VSVLKAVRFFPEQVAEFGEQPVAQHAPFVDQFISAAELGPDWQLIHRLFVLCRQ